MAHRDEMVYRVEKGQGRGLGCVLGGFAVLVLAALGSEGAGIFLAVVIPAIAVGFVLGNRFKQGRCSYCSARMPTEEGKCSKCGGVIQGTVSSAADAKAALAARERDD